MSTGTWFSLAVFLLVAAVCFDVTRGWRRLNELRFVPAVLPAPTPMVSIVVAALNEADTIAPALRSLLAIDYPRLEVIVVNDRSTDATPQIIDDIAREHPSLRVIHIHELPSGWLGKNHALQRGAQAASGDYLLFTDADAVFAPSAVRRAVAYCAEHRIDHLSLLFELVAHSRLLRLLVVSFGAGFMARFRPWKVRESPSHHVGIGGFNLVGRAAYFDAGGHAAMPLAVLDDMMLGKLLKRHGYRQDLLIGTDMVRIEWYRNTAGLVRGLEKNIFAGFDYRLAQLIAVTVLVLATRVWPWLGLLLTDGLAWRLNLLTVMVGLLLYADLLRARGWGLECLVYAPLVPLIELAIWWRGALLVLLRGGIDWRGTRYPLAMLRRAHDAGGGEIR
ncbi:glycosyltransferase [Noviherbaspirillum aridicola]|uniref:Glycosyl hydrolase n=1 Tax=Noviherbaspirillum aridicola TaxID=2849687 RepID=A0ABQ4PZC3_9BURK|nr:glycosyltransferase family 2 protein [Noviherbaspirillum aridicola]GIZ50171.1 glycosyl hydrolase [Noviherbaspirillum aridicola]